VSPAVVSSPKITLLTLFLGVVAGLWALSLVFGQTQTDFEKTGLGKGTTGVFLPSDTGEIIHCGGDLVSLQDCLRTATAHDKPAVLVVGFSMLHGVNEYAPGDLTVPYLLWRKFHEKMTVVSVSLPSLTPLEQLVLVRYALENATFKAVLLPVWLQGMTFESVRPSMLKVRDALASDYDRPSDDILNAKYKMTSKAAPREVSESTQQWAEKELVAWAEESFSLFELRPEAQGQISIFLKNIRHPILQLRNWLLGMDVKDRLIPIGENRYQLNVQAWRDTLDVLADAQTESETKTILYIPPIPENYFPFSPVAYNRFKGTAGTMAAYHSMTMYDLEASVKGDVWGKIYSGGALYTDFNHFKAEGHAQLYQALEEVIRKEVPVKNRGKK